MLNIISTKRLKQSR